MWKLSRISFAGSQRLLDRSAYVSPTPGRRRTMHQISLASHLHLRFTTFCFRVRHTTAPFDIGGAQASTGVGKCPRLLIDSGPGGPKRTKSGEREGYNRTDLEGRPDALARGRLNVNPLDQAYSTLSKLLETFREAQNLESESGGGPQVLIHRCNLVGCPWMVPRGHTRWSC